jgi:hypothetical protein
MSTSVVYRYWSASNVDHFYTTNRDEIGSAIASQFMAIFGKTAGHVGGYLYEGGEFAVFNQPHDGLIPVYRYYNNSTSDHFYTPNAYEIGTTNQGQVGNHGYTSEGVLGYVSPVPFPGSMPVHRYWQETTHDHFYTVNVDEIGTTNIGSSGKHGYKYEGIIGYAYPAESNRKTVHRYWQAATFDHLYTDNTLEIGTNETGKTGNNGYTSEGVAFHMFSHHGYGLVPVYRYWLGSKHDHFYTANTTEIGTTQPGQVGNHGYVCEGVLGYVGGYYESKLNSQSNSNSAIVKQLASIKLNCRFIMRHAIPPK